MEATATKAVLLALASMVIALATSPAVAQSSASVVAPPPTGYNQAGAAHSTDEVGLRTRSTLTGDWAGIRSALADNGVTLDFRHTSFYQGLASGAGAKNYEYGGKLDGFIDLDSSKMGLWAGGGFHSHLEYSHGDAPANLGGAIFAVNTALYWPVDTPEKLVGTSLYFTQKVGERSTIAVGKFNPVDLLAADPFYGGWGVDRFMNLVLAAPPSGLIPVVFMGGIASIKTNPISWTIMVFDPDDRTNDYLPGDLFEDGVNVSVSGAFLTTLSGRKTTYAVTGLYSSAEGADFSTLPPGFETTSLDQSYNVSFEFKHNLYENKAQSDVNWGIYLKVAIADGNPNYVKSSVIAGIAGNAVFFERPEDSFGLGAFYYNLSDDLQNSLSPSTKFRDEAAIEAYYDYSVTPWLRVGPHLQYIKPAAGSFDNAFFLGMRLQIGI